MPGKVATIASLHPPARCPGCGLGVKLTLVADPGTPMYHCGSTPTRIVCRMLADPDWRDLARVAHELADHNVVIPTDADLEAFGWVIGRALVAWTPDPRIGLCTVVACDQTAIYGSCLDHAL